MIRATGPIRAWLTAALVVAVPLCCCCRGQAFASALLGGGSGQPCDTASTPDAQASAHAHHEEEVDNASPECGQGKEDDGGFCGDGQGSPCRRGEPCDCGHSFQAATVSGTTDLVGLQQETPVAIAGRVEFQNALAGTSRGVKRAHGGRLARPPTTLLRLRCALIL